MSAVVQIERELAERLAHRPCSILAQKQSDGHYLINAYVGRNIMIQIEAFPEACEYNVRPGSIASIGFELTLENLDQALEAMTEEGKICGTPEAAVEAVMELLKTLEAG